MADGVTFHLPLNPIPALPVINAAIEEYNKTGMRVVIVDEGCGIYEPGLYHEVGKMSRTITPLTPGMLEYVLLSAGMWGRGVDMGWGPLHSFHPAYMAKILDIAKIAPDKFPNLTWK
ncbi:MAG: hypothetical protein O0X96_06820 [Methanocorpusculum sp.]|nr:hypothetical protein [Methanocorpusculum sp.]